MNFWEWLCYVLTEEMSFDIFLPYGPMLTETKKNGKKAKIQNFEKKMSWRYGEKVPFHQFGINMLAKWHKVFNFWRIAKTSNSLYSL